MFSAAMGMVSVISSSEYIVEIRVKKKERERVVRPLVDISVCTRFATLLHTTDGRSQLWRMFPSTDDLEPQTRSTPVCQIYKEAGLSPA